MLIFNNGFWISKQGLQIQDLLYEKIQVHRDILALSKHFDPSKNSTANKQNQYQGKLLQTFSELWPHNSHSVEDFTLTGLLNVAPIPLYVT